MRNILIILLLMCGLIFALISCDDNPSEPEPTEGILNGTIQAGTKSIHPAYIFMNDSLVTTTDAAGNFSIGTLKVGTYELLCSALFYRDTTLQVQVSGGKDTNLEVSLTADSRTGKIFGEFQDAILFEQALANDTTGKMQHWDTEEIFVSVTGATLQTKTFGIDVGKSSVMLGDSLIAGADAFGQFWFNIPWGTYPITVLSDGFDSDDGRIDYEPETRIIRVLPDQIIYEIFILKRK